MPDRLVKPSPQTIKIPKLIELWRDSGRQRFEQDVHAGLAATPKHLSSMYFYDQTGSDLFRSIMELPEYYVTRVEREILLQHAAEITAPLMDARWDVIDLGAGDGVKTRILLERLRGRDARYVPIDISERALLDAGQACSKSFPWLPVQPVRAEYFAGIAHIAALEPERKRLVLLLGSNIGNLEQPEARGFFRSLRDVLRPGDRVLVGFDLVKDLDVLQRAYDDSAGVTAQFNLNLLRRINRELKGHFHLSDFRHHATFSHARQAMESHLVSKRNQTVRVGKSSYEFSAWEPIYTEISCKYRESDIHGFAQAAGFVELGLFTDERNYFIDALWGVPEACPGETQP
jgi:L-histidine N-alpha-methyltransferase